MAKPEKARQSSGTPPIVMSNPVRLALSAASGLILVTAFPSFHFYQAAWISVAILMVALAGARPAFGALCSFVHGVAFFTPSLTWLYTTFRLHGGVGPAISCVALGAIVVISSLYSMIFGWSFAWISRRSFALACLAAPFLWVTQEFARVKIPGIAFPWNLLGYGWSHNLAIAQLASLGGLWTLSFLATAFPALVVWGINERRGGRRVPILIAVCVTAVLIFVMVYGDRWVPNAAPDHTARLVQSNFPEPDSFPPDWMTIHSAEVDQLERMSTAPDTNGNPPGLVVWSEVPAPFSMQDPKFASLAMKIARGTRDGFLVGVIDWKVAPGTPWRVYNSAALIDPSGRETFLYDKIDLVPFSERLPFGSWFAFVRKITPDVGNFQPGTEWKVGTLPDGRRFGVFICYEAVFPGEVRRFVATRRGSADQYLERWLVRAYRGGGAVTWTWRAYGQSKIAGG